MLVLVLLIFSHFEIEESFGLMRLELQNDRLHLQISILDIQKVLFSNMGFIFAHFVHKESLWQIWMKITE